MKRLVILFSMVALVFGMIPVRVDAVSANPDGPVSFGNYGTFATNDIQHDYTSTADGIKEWSYYLTVGNKSDVIYFSLIPNAVEIQDVKAGSGFLLENVSDGPNGIKNVLIYNSSGSTVSKGQRVLLFTVITKDVGEDKTRCTLSVSPGSLECAVIENNYFDKNGNQVDTESEYKASCEGVTNDVPNADTGSVVPYVAVAGGLIAIAGVYFYSRKANKMYRI